MSRRPSWSLPELRFVAPGAAGIFLLCWALIHHFFWAHGNLVDWPTYQAYGNAIVDTHLVPYRDFPVEYPPGALPTFILPSLWHGRYASALSFEMAVCGVLLVCVVAWIRREAAFYVALVPVLAGSVILSRFDLWPALLATTAVGLLLADRHRLGWGFLGAAVVAKLWPLVIVPLAIVWSVRRGHGRAIGVGALVLAVVVIPFAIVAPHGLYASVEGQMSRPLQIESLGGAFLMATRSPTIIDSHGSQNIYGYTTIGTVLSIVEIATQLGLWVAFARGPLTAERLVRYTAACVVAFVAFDKVLSPQYLLWLAPLVALVRGRRGLLALAALTLAFVLTQLWFPARYFKYALKYQLAGVVFERDIVLVVLLVILAFPASRLVLPMRAQDT